MPPKSVIGEVSADRAVRDVQGTLNITNSTISGNFADNGFGGGIYNGYSSPLTLTQVTITNNHAAIAGGGINFLDASGTVANSIIAGNTAGASDPDTQSFYLNQQGNNFIGG